MSRRLALIASSLAVAALLVGCGSDDDSSDDGGDTSTTEASEEETTASADDTTTESSAATDGTETSEATDGTETTITASAEEVEAFCAAYDSFDQAAYELPQETIEDIRSGATILRESLEEVSDASPEELVDDVDLLVEALVQLEEIAEASDTIEEAETDYAEAYGEKDYQSAADAIDSFFGTNCPQAEDDQAEADDGSGG